MERLRGFEVVADWARKFPFAVIVKPKRGSKNAAAYDFFAVEERRIPPGCKVEFHTDIKAYMLDDEVLHLYPRSNQGIKFDLALANTTGVIDADYYSNPNNDGAISIVLRNIGREAYTVKAGDRIAQGEFAKYLLADDDDASALPTRQGGVGSTGK